MSTQEQALSYEFPRVTQAQLALKDVTDGFVKWRVWFMLAYQDIKLRYRRSALGPFWITISMAITVYSMGFLYAHLFHVQLDQYYPFLVAGMLSWSLISMVVTDFTDGLIVSGGLIKQIKLPYSLHIHRIACRNFIIFFHNILVIIPIMIIYHSSIRLNLYTLMFIPGLLLIYVNCFTYGFIIALFGARFRDMQQLIKNLVQVAFFVTPVMWKPETLGDKYLFLLNLNPFYAFIELIRAPLLGTAPTMLNIAVTFATTILGIVVCAKLLTRCRSRIVYWL